MGAKTADGLREAVAHADKRLSEESLNASQQSSVLRRELQEKEEQLAQSRETHRREEQEASVRAEQELEANDRTLSRKLSAMTKKLQGQELKLNLLEATSHTQGAEITVAEREAESYESQARLRQTQLDQAEDTARAQSEQHTRVATASKANYDEQVARQKIRGDELERNIEDAERRVSLSHEKTENASRNMASLHNTIDQHETNIEHLQAQTVELKNTVKLEEHAHREFNKTIVRLREQLQESTELFAATQRKFNHESTASQTLFLQQQLQEKEIFALKKDLKRREATDEQRRKEYENTSKILHEEVLAQKISLKEEPAEMAILRERLTASQEEFAAAWAQHARLDAAEKELAAEKQRSEISFKTEQAVCDKLRQERQHFLSEQIVDKAALHRNDYATQILKDELSESQKTMGQLRKDLTRRHAELELTERKLTDAKKKEELADARIITLQREPTQENNTAKFKYATAAIGLSLALGGYAGHRYRTSGARRSHKMPSR